MERGSHVPRQELGIISSIEHALLPEAARMLQTVRAEIPEALEGFLPGELEFLSEVSSTSLNFEELGLKYGAESRTLRRFYNDAMVHVWVATIGNTGEQFSINEVLGRKRKSKPRRKITTSRSQDPGYLARREVAMRNWQNPEYRKRAEAEAQQLHESYLAKKRSSRMRGYKKDSVSS